jgi:hypothetical protein
VLLVVLALALGAIGGLLAGWLMGRRRTPDPSGVAGGPVGPGPMPNGGREAAKPTAGSTVRSSPEPRGQRNGVAALGYVSAREPEAVDGPELRDQMAALKERIKAMRESGMTLQAIADSLNAENVPTLRGGTMWRPSGVQAAAGYSRPGREASEGGNGGERDADSSSGERRERSRRSATSRGEGATR